MTEINWAPPSTSPPPPPNSPEHDVAVQAHSDAYWYATCQTCGWVSTAQTAEQDASVAAGRHHQAVTPPPANKKGRGWLIAVGGLAAVLIVAGVAGGSTTDDPPSSPTSGSPVANLSTSDAEDCSARMTQSSTRLSNLVSDMENSGYSEAEVRGIIHRGRDIVADGRQIITDCGQYAPVEAGEAAISLRGFERAIDNLEDTADSIY